MLRLLRDDVQADDVFGWGAPGSPRHRVLTGYLARAVGDRELARGQLALAAAYYRGELEGHDADRGMSPEWAAWVELLEADAARA